MNTVRIISEKLTKEHACYLVSFEQSRNQDVTFDDIEHAQYYIDVYFNCMQNVVEYVRFDFENYLHVFSIKAKRENRKSVFSMLTDFDEFH